MANTNSVETTAADSGSRPGGSEPLGTVQLDAHARQIAAEMGVVEHARDRTDAFRRSFEADVGVIEDAYDQSVTWATEDGLTVPVAEWLLDNFYVVREQIRDIRDHLPPSFFRELPKLSDGSARVHLVARELITHCDSALDEELIVHFVDQFQLNAELTIGETWAVPVMLRLVLIENLSAICRQLIQEYQALRDVDTILEIWERDGRFRFSDGSSLRCAPTVLALYARLRGQGAAYADARSSLERHLQSLGWSLTDLRKFEQHRLAANQVSIGNIITSMRLLGSLDWVSFFEQTNRTERILRRDPQQIYEQMDFPSRNRYRNAVEQLARGSTSTETDVAQHALRLAQTVYSQSGTFKSGNAQTTAEALNSVGSHIGFWLIDDGRVQIEKLIHFQPKLSEKLHYWMLRHPHTAYFGGLALVSLILLALLFSGASTAVIAVSTTIAIMLLAVIPVSEIAQQIVNSFVTHSVHVRLLPKLEFRDGVSEEFPTFIVVPSMLTSEKEAQSLLAKLENHYLANPESTFLFALLTDFADAPAETLETDEAILQSAIAGLRQMNQRYQVGGKSPFYLFHRERRWNPSEQIWMGWERKRGKLMEFGQLLAGSEHTSYIVQEGCLERLAEFRDPANTPFVITLDSDTMLPRGTPRGLVGTLAHPLNRPIIDSDSSGHFVKRGYSILQPRVSFHLGDAQKTHYLRVHAVNSGIDPYSSAASDVYQDLFGEGSFTGKGIYDLRAFEQTVSTAFPENQVLSHDLIEGCHARVALVSDIQVFDGFPARLDADAKRQHRWVRGDWQISPWLFRNVPTSEGKKRNSLSALSRWKILDNLRRSLIAPTLFAFLIVGWMNAPELAWWWSALAVFSLGFPVLIHSVTGLFGWSSTRGFSEQFRAYSSGIANTSEQSFYAGAFLPYKALQMTDAVIRTLFQMLLTRRGMLKWETAAATESRLKKSKWSLLRELSVCSIAATVIFLLIDSSAAPAAAPWLMVWFLAPMIGHIISSPRKNRMTSLQLADRDWLVQMASGTWSYFEQFVNPAGNWLPPDNVQDYPKEKVAYRTSPTNEGLFLVSGLVANRLGFIGLQSLVELWEKNLASWNSLEQLHGHHFNWYATNELKALHPYYVSTVDSGNLMACYFTLCEGIAELARQPIVAVCHRDGARASLKWLRQQADATKSLIDDDFAEAPQQREDLIAFQTLIDEIVPTIEFDGEAFVELRKFVQSLLTAAGRLEEWAAARSTHTMKSLSVVEPSVLATQAVIVAKRFRGICRDIDHFMPWLSQVVDLQAGQKCFGSGLESLNRTLVPGIGLRELSQLPTVLEAGREWGTAKNPDSGVTRHTVGNVETGRANSSGVINGEVMSLIRKSSAAAEELLLRLKSIRDRCEAAAFRMDFDFLYNPRRKLFSIGYNVDIGKLDRGHYDLLCSECRIASYLAIAKGDVETEHWYRLGRPATLIEGQYSLLSWGGTMFEFLMPQLFQRSYEGSLIDTSCRTAVDRQIAYGRHLHLPWGISESGYSAMASNSDYQYKSFGVPGLGLKRGLSKDIVVSSYSSAMALPFVPKSAASNLKYLAEFATGRWGLYEAVDYTPSRLRRNQSANVVRCYMAHHHGMTLLAIANAAEDHVITRWFHAHPLVRANELLLQERVSALVNSEVPNPDEVEPANSVRESTTLVSRQISGIYAVTPRVMLLANGQFSSLLTHTGGGYARHNQIQITRWRSDSTRDHWGNFIYLRDKDSGDVWSATFQPTRIVPDHYEVLFSVDKGEVRRRQGEIESVMELVVSPDHNAEVRQLRIMNHGTKVRRIEVTSYAEIVLASQQADLAHPAFQKLFVETEYIQEDTTLIARRRPRDARQEPTYALHTLALPSAYAGSVDYESSREKFLGRGGTVESPVAMQNEKLSRTTGAVLDAVFSLRCVVTIEPAESVTLGITTAAAASREQALSLADLFHDMRGVCRAFELAWAFTQVELRHLNITATDVHLFQQLGGHLLYPETSLRCDPSKISSNRPGQNALWRFGISGDVPILLLRIAETTEIDVVREVVEAHNFLMLRGLAVDLVISNDYPGAYFDLLQEQLQSIINERQSDNASAKRLFLLRGAQLSSEDHQLLDVVAAVLLRGSRGSLAQQLESATIKSRKTSVQGMPRVHRSASGRNQKSRQRQSQADQYTPAANIEFANGFGGFTDDGRHYEMLISPVSPTPAPWSNVIANAGFGCLLTESGGGYTWFGNSRENKLTDWSNDPTTDPPAEIIYLQDRESEVYWLPMTPSEQPVVRQVIHSQGYSLYRQNRNGIQTEILITVHVSDPLKIVRLRLHNTSDVVRHLQATYYAETVMGVSREATVLHQVSGFDAERVALTMENGYHPEYKTQLMFLTILCDGNVSWTADRRSFLGRDGSLTEPAAMKYGLNQRAGAALDPCLALQGTVSIEPGGTEECIFLLGAAGDRVAALELLDAYSTPDIVSEAISNAKEHWNQILSALTVQTPNRAMDLMINRWLPYQVLSCRLWGRSAFYQSGGAYGFRDQLQDVMALVYSRPELTRDHILKAAARQYPEGDVQHWWHPPGGKGTRTRFSDDFLFLPFVVLHYVRITGDRTILEEVVPYIESPALTQHEQERYEQPVVSEQSGTLLEHCLKATVHGMRYGQHDLPLMGCGDWNDGMNKIGENGQGESVWVAWFQIVVFEDLAKLLRELNSEKIADAAGLEQQAAQLRAAVEKHAWDGEWYLRAFFDDGTPLGSRSNDECQIDSLAQSWAVIAGGPKQRSRQAFESAVARLVKSDSNIILLFEPPFDQTALDPGYVKGYVPGVRENGGQYTHAALWLVQAATVLQKGELAMKLFNQLNPIHHSDSPEKAERYRVEPYVVAADVYANADYVGRGGWSWYTGAAGWMFRVAVEDILGIRVESSQLFINPTLPESWNEFQFTYRRNSTKWHIRALKNTAEVSNPSSVQLVEDGRQHQLTLGFSTHRSTD